MDMTTHPPSSSRDTADAREASARSAVKPERTRYALPHSGGLRLGTWFGIEIRLEASWFVIFALLTISFAGNLSIEHPALLPEIRWPLAVGTSILFFGSILLHELAHSLVARRRGLEVHGITLMLFGGVSHLASEPKRPKDDLAIAVVGPLTSAALGAFFLALAQLLSPLPLAKSVVSWLGFINLGLAAFNLLPGFPLDGGRVLKALIWSVTGSAERAYRLAIAAGKFVAYGMIFAGVFMAFGLHWSYDGLWIGFIGWYLLSGAQASRLQLTMADALRQHLVRDALRPADAIVRPDETLAAVVEAWVLNKGCRTLAVSEGGKFLGLVTLHQIKELPRSSWASRMVCQIMIPIDRLITIMPEQNLLQAFQRMSERQVSQVPVVSDGALIGMLSREDVLRVFAIHMELNALSSKGS
jgi:Zn-dependent protease/CBS domain-containing protein